KAEKKLGFKKEETLFIDDTEAVLRTAKKFGIRYILHKVVASSKLKPRLSKDFLHIFDFSELM
ncbi:MAG: HAD-IA family hydrolase, partial [Thermodesulfovibrionales bacterium]|nr:HAD-IA family hydrolase [Thermodesulfovibrionales bacterium]